MAERRILETKADLDLWHPAPGYEGLYEITASGKVRSLPRYVNSPAAGGQRRIRGKELAIQSVKGYPGFLARDANGRKTTAYIHRLLALIFLPNPCGKPQVNHIDGDKTNFAISNLEWATPAENIRHAITTGLNVQPSSGPGDKSRAAKLTWDGVAEIRSRIANGEAHATVAKRFGVQKGTIGFIARNETWRMEE